MQVSLDLPRRHPPGVYIEMTFSSKPGSRLWPYPNPFNSGTTIRFTVEGSQHASLKIYNVLGQQVRTLLDEEIEGGVHSEIWNGRNARGEPVGTGVYFCRLSAGDMRATIRLLNLR